VHSDEIGIRGDENIIKIKDELMKAVLTFVSCLGRISERKTIRLRRLSAHKNYKWLFGGLKWG